jgi:drug/metabolite transporter (DMT)-like permease
MTRRAVTEGASSLQSNKMIILISVLVPLFWSLVFPLSKIVLPDLPPLTVVSLRYSLGAAFLTLVALITRKGRETGSLLRTKWPAMWTLGFIAVVSNASQVIGLSYSSAAAGTIIASTAPIYAAVLGALLLREKITANQIAGLLLSLGGVTGITLAGNDASGGNSASGTVLMFVGAITYALYTVLGKKWDASSVPVLAVSTGLGVIPFLVLAAVTEPFGQSLAAASPQTWLNLIALGVLPTGMAVIWYFMLVSRLGATRASCISYLVPVFGLLQSSLLLKEHLSPGLLLGGLASLAGVALAQYQGRTKIDTETSEQAQRLDEN